jgi:hypothetical protein
MPPRSALVLIAGLMLAAACDRRVEPWVPVEQEPERASKPVRIPGLERPEARVRGLEPMSRAEIQGEIRLAEGVVAPAGATLFLIARSGAGGPPLAVKRLPSGPFPMPFSLGAGDVMIPGRAFEGPLTVSARVDVDGDPLSRGDGDLEATLGTPVEAGASDIVLELR